MPWCSNIKEYSKKFLVIIINENNPSCFSLATDNILLCGWRLEIDEDITKSMKFITTFLSSSEAFASELPENLEEMVSWYW